MKSHVAAPERLLIFDVGSEKAAQLRQICERLGVQLRELSGGQMYDTVGSLADSPGDTATALTPAEGGKECIIFSGFSEKRLDEALKNIRENIPGGIRLKAVVTPHNRKMTLGQLINELEREHEALKGKSLRE